MKKAAGCGCLLACLLFGGCVVIALIAPDRSGPSLEDRIAERRQPAAAPEVAPAAAPEVTQEVAAPAAVAEPTIPSIQAVDVYGNLTDKGFSAPKMTSLGGGHFEWRCKKESPAYSYEVEIFGTGPTRIHVVVATVLNFSAEDTDALAKDFLGDVATLRYNGSSPERARRWVLANVGKAPASTVIHGVQFKLSGEPDGRARILRLSKAE